MSAANRNTENPAITGQPNFTEHPILATKAKMADAMETVREALYPPKQSIDTKMTHSNRQDVIPVDVGHNREIVQGLPKRPEDKIIIGEKTPPPSREVELPRSLLGSLLQYHPLRYPLTEEQKREEEKIKKGEAGDINGLYSEYGHGGKPLDPLRSTRPGFGSDEPPDDGKWHPIEAFARAVHSLAEPPYPIDKPRQEVPGMRKKAEFRNPSRSDTRGTDDVVEHPEFVAEREKCFKTKTGATVCPEGISPQSADVPILTGGNKSENLIDTFKEVRKEGSMPVDPTDGGVSLLHPIQSLKNVTGLGKSNPEEPPQQDSIKSK